MKKRTKHPESILIYIPLLVVFVISILNNNFDFSDKLIDLSFLMFAIFVAGITLSNRNTHKKQMLVLSYIFLVAGLLLLIGNQVLKIDGGLTNSNFPFIISYFGGLIFFLIGLYVTFNLIHKIIDSNKK